MKVMVELYRIRETDKAHALIGQEVAHASNLENAIRTAQHLAKILNMPQWSDAMLIADSDGYEFQSYRFQRAGTSW